MVGKRESKEARPVASSHRLSTPCRRMRSAMALLTTSRGASSSTNRSPRPSRNRAPCPRSASDSSGRGMAGWCRAVGWNCMNSTSATGIPARRAMARPSAVASAGLVVTANNWPAPPVANTVWVARTSTTRPSALRARTPRHRPPSTSRSRANHSSRTAAAVVLVASTRARSTSAPVAAPPGMDDPRRGVAPLVGQRQRPAGLAVEDGAHGDELVDPRRALVHQYPHRVGVAQAGAGGQGVGQVEIGGVLVAAEHGGHPPLGPAGGRLGELGLGQYADPEPGPAGGPVTGRCHRRSQPDRGRQAGHTAPQHQDVEGAGVPVRTAHARSGEGVVGSGPWGSRLSINRTGPTAAAMRSRSGRVAQVRAGSRSSASTTAA